MERRARYHAATGRVGHIGDVVVGPEVAHLRVRARGKYNAVKTTVDGVVFDSKHEADRYSELRLLQLAGEIENLELQPAFEIVVNDKRICKYRADFRYRTVGAKADTIEDAKGVRTPVYRLKKKLVEAMYGIEIIEV